MKIRPVILCGGAGTRLWPKAKKHQAKQFIDFGNWTLFGKTLERVKASIFDVPIISTNAKYLKQVKQHLKKHKIRKFKIVLEPAKRNTAPAILSTALIKDIPNEQPLMFLAADHLIEKIGLFNKATAKSFDYAILEKTKDINAIKLDIPWSDLGSWKEICKMYGRNKRHYFKKKNVFHRPWGSYVNLFNGKEFLIKELYVKPKGILSLQKHHHRAEHWVVTHGKPKITLNKKYFTMKPDETIFIPLGAIHRIENPYKKPVKIIEAQVGSILKETDIVRFQDIYGRVK